MKLKGKKSFFEESPCWLGSGSFSANDIEEDIMSGPGFGAFCHSHSLCARQHVLTCALQPEIKFRGLRQQQAEMSEPSATPQHQYEKPFAPADHLTAPAAADFGNPSVDWPR